MAILIRNIFALFLLFVFGAAVFAPYLHSEQHSGEAHLDHSYAHEFSVKDNSAKTKHNFEIKGYCEICFLFYTLSHQQSYSRLNSFAIAIDFILLSTFVFFLIPPSLIKRHSGAYFNKPPPIYAINFL